MFANTITLAPPLSKPKLRDIAPQGVAAQTLLRTIIGPRPVDRIMAGDLLIDATGQIVELRGIRKVRARAGELVRLKLGAMPELNRDLIVGAGQKLALCDWRTDVIFGKPCLSAARCLIDGDTVRAHRMPGTLYQLSFDTDVVIEANGLPALMKAR